MTGNIAFFPNSNRNLQFNHKSTTSSKKYIVSNLKIIIKVTRPDNKS